MNAKDLLVLDALSDSSTQDSPRYYSNQRRNETYVFGNIMFLIIGFFIGLFFSWFSTLNGESIDPSLSLFQTKLIITLAFSYLGFSFYAGYKILVKSSFSIFTFIIFIVTGIWALIIAFSIAIGFFVSIPIFIHKLRNM